MSRNPELPPDLLEQVESFEEAEEQLQLIQELRVLVDNAQGTEQSYRILDHLWTVSTHEPIAIFLSEREIVAITIHLLLTCPSDNRLTQLCLVLLATTDKSAFPDRALEIGRHGDLRQGIDAALQGNDPATVSEFLRLLYAGLVHEASRPQFLGLVEYSALLMWLDLSRLAELTGRAVSVLLLLQLYDPGFPQQCERLLDVLARVLAAQVETRLAGSTETQFDSLMQLVEVVSAHLRLQSPLEQPLLESLADVIANYGGEGSHSAVIALANLLPLAREPQSLRESRPALVEQIGQLVRLQGQAEDVQVLRSCLSQICRNLGVSLDVELENLTLDT